MNDEQALRGLTRGNPAALEWILSRYAPYVGAVVYNIIGGVMPRADVEEVSSDVFLALWNNAEKPKPGSLKPYLGSIARNLAKNKLRGRRLDLSLESDEIDLPSPETPEAALLDEETRALVRQAVLSMEEPDREIFLRHYYSRRTVAEIAADMHMNESTVKSRLSRGRQKLKQTLQLGGFSDENENLGSVRLRT